MPRKHRRLMTTEKPRNMAISLVTFISLFSSRYAYQLSCIAYPFVKS